MSRTPPPMRRPAVQCDWVDGRRPNRRRPVRPSDWLRSSVVLQRSHGLRWRHLTVAADDGRGRVGYAGIAADRDPPCRRTGRRYEPAYRWWNPTGYRAGRCLRLVRCCAALRYREAVVRVGQCVHGRCRSPIVLDRHIPPMPGGRTPGAFIVAVVFTDADGAKLSRFFAWQVFAARYWLRPACFVRGPIIRGARFVGRRFMTSCRRWGLLSWESASRNEEVRGSESPPPPSALPWELFLTFLAFDSSARLFLEMDRQRLIIAAPTSLFSTGCRIRVVAGAHCIQYGVAACIHDMGHSAIPTVLEAPNGWARSLRPIDGSQTPGLIFAPLAAPLASNTSCVAGGRLATPRDLGRTTTPTKPATNLPPGCRSSLAVGR